jgi:hypothetical protein
MLNERDFINAKDSMQYTWHWIFHSETLQCDCPMIHYEKNSAEIYSSVERCIQSALEEKPKRNNHVLLVKEQVHTIKFPTLVDVSKRLKTFEHWPKYMIPSAKTLADIGFYYKGIGDRVQWHCCGVILMNWKPDDSPIKEHLKYSSNCEFIRQCISKDQTSGQNW